MCQPAQLHFDTVVPLGGYRAGLREAVLRIKRRGGEPLAEAMARLYVLRRGAQVAEQHADVVVPIPMHWTRRMVRETNSSEVLAARLGRALGLPLAQGRLVHWRRTLPQKSLPPRERFRNVHGAFRLCRAPRLPAAFRQTAFDLRGARVLLVDDVLTTGATCSEAAKVLKQGGAAWVAVAVLDRAMGDRVAVAR
jgi:ComF family protein